MKQRKDFGIETPFGLVARRLRAMADPMRLAIIHRLCGGERNVTELVAETRSGQASVSKHLAVLRAEGLVEARRNHRHVYYRLSSSLPEEICRMVCASIEARTAGERRALRRYLAGASREGAGRGI